MERRYEVETWNHSYNRMQLTTVRTKDQMEAGRIVLNRDKAHGIDSSIERISEVLANGALQQVFKRPSKEVRSL